MNDSLCTLFTYESWANQQALDSLKQAENPSPRAHQVMGHLVAAQILWLSRLRGEAVNIPVWPELGLGDCAAQLEKLTDQWSQFVSSLTDEALRSRIEYKTSRGDTWQSRVDEILFHVLLHGSYHRGQIAAMLGRNDQQPAATDLIVALRQGAVDFDTP